MEQGLDRVRAATFAWTSTAFPMLTGTLVTAAGFLPVGFAKSSAGEYAGSIFWMVGLALLVSWIVAVLFTPYLGVMLLPDFTKPGASDAHAIPTRSTGPASIAPCGRAIEFALAWRKTVVAVTVTLFVAFARRIWPGAAAVLPDLDPHRIVLRDAAAGGHCDRRHRCRRQEG